MFIVFGKKAFYAIFALLLVLSALAVSFALPPKAAQTSGAAAVGNTVWVIDAGHGGKTAAPSAQTAAGKATSTSLLPGGSKGCSFFSEKKRA